MKLDFSLLGLLVGGAGGLFCFWLGRRLRDKRLDQRKAGQRAAQIAMESRQVRRARQRRERGR
jgi:hypothetical protein